jgi:hypothetical protein
LFQNLADQTRVRDAAVLRARLQSLQQIVGKTHIQLRVLGLNLEPNSLAA